MKKLYLFSFFLLYICLPKAQPWLEYLPQNKSPRELTFFDYQQAFESYWAPFNIDKGFYFENGQKIKAPGWKQFKRWEYAMESRINPRTGEFPSQTAMQAYKEHRKSNPDTRSSATAKWKSLGPDYSHSGYSGVGRINCVAFHPDDNNTYWVGAAAGGLWMTSDNGLSWTCLTNDNGVLAVSDMVIPADYSSSQTIYIATGDRDSWDNRSIGVLKSVDGGASWNETGLSFSLHDASMVNRILIDPADHQVLIAATTSGAIKTTDGGLTWNTLLTPVEFIDMEYKPGDFNTLYGSTRDGQIYVSTSAGTFWNIVYDNENTRRIELAVTPAQPKLVYAAVVNDENGLYGIYKSGNSGQTFNLLLDGYFLNLLSYSSWGEGTRGQGYYDLGLAVSPSDSNTVLVGGINTWRSTDGGYSWNIVNHWYGDQAQEVHADKHNLRYRHNGDLFECNDGGIYFSPDNGTSWQDKTNGISISQMYRLGVSQTNASEIITGLQDNGTKFLSGDEWHDRIGGDGMECLIDYTDFNIQYGTLYYGQLYRTTDHWNDYTDISAPDEGAWVTPFVIDPVNPEILYAGYTEVWQSFDRGDIWFPISIFSTGNKLRSMAIAPSDPQVLYVADHDHIWKTTNTGGDWIEITGNLPVDDANILSISVRHDNPNTLWITLSGYTTPGVYESTDAGMTWTNISGGLPDIPVYTVVQNKLIGTKPHLYAGTALGVYFKNGDQPWARFSHGLPNVEVSELEIYYPANPSGTLLRAATYGRGLWETPIPFSSIPVSSISTITPICSGSNASLHLISYTGNIQWQQSMNGDTNWTAVTEGDGMTTENFTTTELSSTTFYRAEVIDPGVDTTYSNSIEIPVVPIPDDAGFIIGMNSVCEGTHGVEFSIDTIANADSYVWTLPPGATGAGTEQNILVDFGSNATSGIISVHGQNAGCDGSPSSLPVTVNMLPDPVMVEVNYHPSCTLATGSLSVSGLPDTGVWILALLPLSGTIVSTGTTLTLYGILPGSYSVIVTDMFGCTSLPTDVVLNDQPETPPIPFIVASENILHSNAPDGNQWYIDGNLIDGATQQDYTAIETGNYYTIVTLNECSSLPSNTLLIEITGIQSISEQDIRLYPNPVREELFMEITGYPHKLNFSILNSLGQKVHEGSIAGNKKVATSGLAPGAYLVKFEDAHGSIIKKFIRE